MKLAGLDIETTGTDPNKHHRLIQIGVVVDGMRLKYDVRPSGDMMIQQEAMDINKFTLGRIANALPTEDVDDLLSQELRLAGYKPSELTPVGWNVGGFDMVFIKKELPKTADYFTYRTLDLTGIAILHELRTGRSYRDTKKEFHEIITAKLGRDERHDALYDAEAALLALELFKDTDFQ